MHSRTNTKPQIFSVLRKNIHPAKLQNMVILGLNVTLAQVDSGKDKDRVIAYLNNSLINSRTEFDKIIKDVLEFKLKQDNLKAHIMKNIEEYKKIDPEIFRLLDESDSS